MTNQISLISGSSNPKLFNQIGKYLTKHRQISQFYTTKVDTVLNRFSDGEMRVELKDSVRGTNAYILQSTCAPANDTLMELMLMIDAAKRSSAAEINIVMPYFGYARQDRRPGYSRVPISARVVADMLIGAGADHIITVDLHATQIQGFFSIPVDNIAAGRVLAADMYSEYSDKDRPILVSPDVGGVARARQLTKLISDKEWDLAIVDKRRPEANLSEVMHIVGDVTDRTCVIIDDMIDTAGTLCKAADALMKNGARKVVAYATHGVLSGNALDNIKHSCLSEVVVTDTIPFSAQQELKIANENIQLRQLSLVNLLSNTIIQSITGSSISTMLD